MEYDRLKDLLDKLEQHVANKDELAEIDRFYNSFDEDPTYTDTLVDPNSFQELLFEDIQKKLEVERKKHRIKLLSRISIAAVFLLVISFTIFLVFYKNNTTAVPEAMTNEITPGKEGATLTLSNGKKLQLGEEKVGQLALEDGIEISKDNHGQVVYKVMSSKKGQGGINTLSTSRGQTFQVQLPDGTKVWLNAASSISYTANLVSGGKRKVHLAGEAYFEVSKDIEHPFVVESGEKKIEVLGTHFNVTNYLNDDYMTTTLLEGSIKLNEKVLLKPGQQGIVGKNNTIDIKTVDTDKATAWKDGKFVFDDDNIHTIMRQLSRWYDVDISYEDNVYDQGFTGSVNRFDSITKILDKLSYTNKVHFKIIGRRITVMK